MSLTVERGYRGWLAYSREYDGEQIVGRGRTKQAAIADYNEQQWPDRTK
jgi:hypothetical protein